MKMLSNKFISISSFLGIWAFTPIAFVLLLGSISSQGKAEAGGIGIANVSDPCGAGHPPCNSSLNLECVNGACACITGYSTDRYNLCRKTHGQPCSVVLDCNIDRFIGCGANKTCECFKPEEQIFDEERQSCVSLIGYNCDHDTGGEFSLKCVKNAFCDMPVINGSMIHRCTCNEGYEETEDGYCAGAGINTLSVSIILTLLIVLKFV